MDLSFESPRKQPKTPRKATIVPVHNGSAVPSFTMSTVPSLLEKPQAEFKPTLMLYLAFGTLAVITMMVALDGTSLSVALPVSCQSSLSALSIN